MMSEQNNTSEGDTPHKPDLQFGEEMIVEEAGFSFRPIAGFELEVDRSVYMYSEDGNLEISMVGGALANETSIAELNDKLAAEFMENFDQYDLIESSKDTIQGITGFLNEIRFVNAEEEGSGRALICSPHINQYFFLLVITSAEYWSRLGQEVYSALKLHVHFHPQFKPATTPAEAEQHPDLTMETYEMLDPQEDLMIMLERGDVSLLLAARTSVTHDEINLTEIHAPGGEALYHYDPSSGVFESSFATQPLQSNQGEVCLFLPCTSQQSLQIGEYRFGFTTKSGMPLQEVQVIIRHGRALGLQKIDLNLWLALENERFNDPDYLALFTTNLHHALGEQLAPMNLAPGKIECIHPAQDELETFAHINLATDLADCSYMIAESVENGRAFNIGLVESITQGDVSEDKAIKSVSSGAPGMILSPVSPHACILMDWSAYQLDFPALAQAMIKQLVVFCGIGSIGALAEPDQPLELNRELAWLLRRHPIFYDAD